MTLRSYYLALRRHWLLVLVSVLTGTIVALTAALSATPEFSAQAQLFVSASSTDGQLSGLNQGGQFAQQRVKSYADIINSRPVTTAVVARLGLSLTPEELAGRISASAPLDTVLIDVDVRDSSAVRARLIANAVADEFTQVAAELEKPAGAAVSPVKVSVVREATLPTTPVSPHTHLDIALGLLLGLLIGIGAALLRETLDTSVRTAVHVHEAAQLPVLGTIAFDAECAKRPLIVQTGPRSPRSEAFRQLRTNLQFLDVDHPPRSLLVTSSLPGEGKSTAACNLAIALAQAGVRVVLVEGDLRRPRVASYLGLEGAVGLTDVLVGRANLADVVQPWGDGTLQFLASGPVPPNPSELLGSRQMQTVLAQLESKVDLVLVDAPPLLPVADAAVLAALTSGALLIVRAGSTRREQLTRAAGALRAVDATIYGVVLNMAPTSKREAYGYTYGHGYGDVPAGATVAVAVAAPRGPQRAADMLPS